MLEVVVRRAFTGSRLRILSLLSASASPFFVGVIDSVAILFQAAVLTAFGFRSFEAEDSCDMALNVQIGTCISQLWI